MKRGIFLAEPDDVRPGDLWRRSGWRWFERGDKTGDRYLEDTIRCRSMYPLDPYYLVEIAREETAS